MGYNYNLNYSSYNTVEQAIKKATFNSKKEDVILITGSTFVVAEALGVIKNMEIQQTKNDKD
jgi:folylpolyglutamate synthase/dihydropteroate synthase